MQTVLIVVHLLIVIALVGTILLQRSEGGALGIGGGGGMLSARGSANFLTRVTAILAMVFFATSLGLTLVSRFEDSGSLLETLEAQQSQGAGGNLFDSLEGSPSNVTIDVQQNTNTQTPAQTDQNNVTNQNPDQETDANIDSLLQSLDETTTNSSSDQEAAPAHNAQEVLLDALNETLDADVTTPELQSDTASEPDTHQLQEFTEQLEQGVGETEMVQEQQQEQQQEQKQE